MQINPVAKWPLLILFALVVGLMAGCKTPKPIDWNARVGNYTYDQAVAELGPPDKHTTLSNGNSVDQWITRSSTGPNFGVGTGFNSGVMGVGVGQSFGPTYRETSLTLIFSTNNVLTSWSQRY